jgi:hypothetical protein
MTLPLGLDETRRGPTISFSFATISSRDNMEKTIDNGEWIIENLAFGPALRFRHYQLSIIHYQ